MVFQGLTSPLWCGIFINPSELVFEETKDIEKRQCSIEGSTRIP